MKKIIYIFILFCIVSACTVESQKKSDENLKELSVTNEKNKTINSETNERAKTQKQEKENLITNSDNTKALNKAECFKVKTGDKSLLKSQTFYFDFKPFEGSCFVTKYDPEYKGPPTSLEISLYKDGKEVYKFDSRFNPNSVTCSIDAVAFEDLNKDNLQDVIIVGKCSTQSGEILANEVFMNTGKGTFYTSIESNDKLEEFNKVEEVTDFVKKNKDIFFE